MPIRQEAILQAAATMAAAKIRNQGAMILGAQVANLAFGSQPKTEADFLTESIAQVAAVLEAILAEHTQVSLEAWNKLG